MRSMVFLLTLSGILLALYAGQLETAFEIGLVISIITFISAVWITRGAGKHKA